MLCVFFLASFISRPSPENFPLVRRAFREKFIGSELLILGLCVQFVFFGVILPMVLLYCVVFFLPTAA